MTIRRGYGDETWALARSADAERLEAAAQLLLRERSGVDYEGHRARAFSLALQRRSSEALQELNAGWTDDWPTAESYAVDVARVHFLARHPAKALTALELDARSTERAELGDLVSLVLDCIEADRRLWPRGLALALASSRGADRMRVPARVLRAWIRNVRRSRVAHVAQPATPGS